MKTQFNIAQIWISVETSFELNISKEYSLYLANPCMTDTSENKEFNFISGTKGADWNELRERDELCDSYEIRMVEDFAFPKMEGKILFHNEMNLYLETNEGGSLHFFRIPLTNQTAAWCETTGRHSLTIHYRKTAKEYFKNVFGCFNAAAFENILYVFRKFLFHCSYVDVRGEAVLFSAHSGGGKTTHALLWEKCGLGEMINGDRAVLEKAESEEDRMKKRGYKPGYIVHGLPIAGSSNVFKNRSLPLRAIFMLEKAPINEIVEIPPAKRFLLVLEQFTIHTWDRDFVEAASKFAAELVQNVPVMVLKCRPDEGAVRVVKEELDVMSKSGDCTNNCIAFCTKD